MYLIQHPNYGRFSSRSGHEKAVLCIIYLTIELLFYIVRLNSSL
jgi:hypothetical protein